MFDSIQSMNLTSVNVTLFLIAIMAWGIKYTLKWYSRREWHNPHALLIVRILDSAVIPLTLISAVVIIFQTLRDTQTFEQYEEIYERISISLVIVFATIAVARSGSHILQWYSDTVAKRTKSTLDDNFAPLIHRVLTIGIYIGGILILLNSLDIPISPMLTSLGLSGLAVALALQPTLESFFAGLQVLTDRVVTVGDYVELEGLEGYVIEIGWRSTRIQTTQRNLVIVPNSRLVSAIITNYDAPVREISVIIEAGVSYESDLEQVERVSLEVMNAVIEESNDAVKNRVPHFGFDSFGDSNINFWVWHYAKSKAAAKRLTSLIIKRLHQRFVEEGIEMNYPVRKVVYEPPESAES